MQQETIISTVTSKSQTVIPKAVRQKLGIEPGDRIRYRMRGDKVEIEKLRNDDSDMLNPFMAFHEWATPEDDDAFKDL